MNAAEVWDKAMIEESQRRATGTTMSTIDDRPRNSLTGKPITFKATATVDRLAPHAGGGRTIPHPSTPLPPKVF